MIDGTEIARDGGTASGALDAARHGSFCPKMCSFACPVTAATGRDDAVPWSFHRTVVDLVDGRLPAGPAAARRLSACSGCLGCQVPCEFDQDVPTQVRTGRAVLAREGHPVAGAEAAFEAVTAGRSPFGVTAPPVPATVGADTVLLVGCRDEASLVTSAVGLLAAAGVEVDVHTPSGCCGAVLADLGYATEAGGLRERLGAELRSYQRVLLLDPHCGDSVQQNDPEGAEVLHLVEHLAVLHQADRLRFRTSERTLTYHDPCLLVRGSGTTSAPRRLLAATGAQVVEPEATARTTFCSGGGLALELVDVEAAAATARHRARQLAAAADHTVTACSGAARSLVGQADTTVHLLDELADHLEEHP